MRPIALFALSLLSAGACARPVLYYPTPERPAAAQPTATQAGNALPTAPGTEMSAPTTADADIEYLRARQIVMPVAGASMSKVANSFDEARDGERVHRAIDIMAPRGTPILSADDGAILRMTTSPLGGISMYAVDLEHRIVYYYAHMDRYHESMSAGRVLVRGDTIGFVGTTGNAPKDMPHLHFQIMRWPADGKYWNGEPINPYPLLESGAREIAKRIAGSP